MDRARLCHLSSTVIGVVIVLHLLLSCADRAVAADGFTFEGLGDLPGGETYSVPYGISADGSIVVGLSGPLLARPVLRFRPADYLKPIPGQFRLDGGRV